MKARHLGCSICSQLGEDEHALQHVQSEPGDTFLPEAAQQLELIREIRTGSLRLQRCPECGTCYLWRTIYEFLIGFGGSYDEYFLRRLSDDVAEDYRLGRRNEPLEGMG